MQNVTRYDMLSYGDMNVNKRDDDNKPVKSVNIIYSFQNLELLYIYMNCTQLQLIHVNCLNNISMAEGQKIIP
jgi:hypothetical protein